MVITITTHATDSDVATAHENANTAKGKLYRAQNQGGEQKLKAKHTAKGKQDDLNSRVSEGSQRAWNTTKKGTEGGWNATKEGIEKGWNKAKEGTVSVEKEVSE